MKRLATLATLAFCAGALANCASEPPPPVHVHHYHTKTRTTTKPASVGGYKAPESFEAVTPPSSYSR
ncbi:hypothetical protein DES53_106333 [Roseimicrobium gellanilyticum]|uniref:Lipoprotein n=1 Tax=Roseimicrobium gellanilyticum TaxID=748857 RepID=A0A366HK56_9BACT|nr:hypothetical protein [Roseimicrobium gellanilyticum]RBP42624.1 hypothetical protein DES53_106333 [Roseimicrobium gellanilyticum]